MSHPTNVDIDIPTIGVTFCYLPDNVVMIHRAHHDISMLQIRQLQKFFQKDMCFIDTYGLYTTYRLDPLGEFTRLRDY